ncbi:MAG: hypothetical protein M3R65_11890 [Gemmatimonadota bacterium]|nr:hypothetical protein [Gemmatimonadota bacterium]
MKNDDSLMDDEQAGDVVARYFEDNPQLLENIAPERDLWPAIDDRISAPVLPMVRPAHHRFNQPHRTLGWIPTLVAASALVAGSAGITYVLTERAAPPATSAGRTATMSGAGIKPSAAEPVAAVRDVDTVGSHGLQQLARDTRDIGDEARSGSSAVPRTHRSESPATPHLSSQFASHSRSGAADDVRATYDSEITKLHAALDARRGQLNPNTVAVIEQNLHVIDEAIRQSREALAKDPNSRLLNDQLDRTLATKTGLLRAAALLPAA